MEIVGSTGDTSTTDANQLQCISNLATRLSATHLENYVRTADAEFRRLQWAVLGPELLQSAGSIGHLAVASVAKEFQGPPYNLTIPPPQSNNERLGHAFERFIAAWLTATPGIKILAHRQQVSVEQRVIGEIDLLFEDASRIWHWELTNKLYLGVPGFQSKPHGWVGPRLNDRFDWKLVKLEAQLTTPIPAALYTHTEKALKHAILGRGCLYYPYIKHANVAPTVPSEIHPNHWYGWWCTQSQAMELLAEGIWIEVDRRDWLTPLLTTTQDQSVDTLAPLQGSNRPFSIFARMQMYNDVFIENLRLAVVDDEWPERAQRFAADMPP